MHPVAYFGSLVQFLYLALLLDKTQGDHSLDKLLRSTACTNRTNLADSLIRKTCQLGQLHLVIISCRRKEMDRTTGRNSLYNSLVELCQRSRTGTSHSLAL